MVPSLIKILRLLGIFSDSGEAQQLEGAIGNIDIKTPREDWPNQFESRSRQWSVPSMGHRHCIGMCVIFGRINLLPVHVPMEETRDNKCFTF